MLRNFDVLTDDRPSSRGSRPRIAIGIMRDLLRTVHRTVSRMSREVAARSA